MKKRTLSLGLRELEYLADAVESAVAIDEDSATEAKGAERRMFLAEAELGRGLLLRLRRRADAADHDLDGDE